MDDAKQNALAALCNWITFLALALPLRSCPTFIELLIGGIISGSGFVTGTYLTTHMSRHWSSYHKWLGTGKWSYLKLAKQLVKLFLTLASGGTIFWVMDDTIVYRASSEAPGSKIHHQHGRKANRPQYVRGQGWLTLAGLMVNGKKQCAIPLLSRLMPGSAQSGKIMGARVLMRALRGLMNRGYLLLDSWFMRGKVIFAALEQGISVIGQVRIDTALYDKPEALQTSKRGRPRKYGRKYTKEVVDTLPVHEEILHVYGRKQRVCYRYAKVMVRFLGGLEALVIWSWFVNEKGEAGKPRLLLSLDTALGPVQVILFYALRWWIEPMFCEVKNTFGLRNTWQQTRRTLQRWVQILSIAYALPRLLAFYLEGTAAGKSLLSPWRFNQRLTAGQVRIWLKKIFLDIRIRGCWDVKSRIFMLPDKVMLDRKRPTLRKAA